MNTLEMQISKLANIVGKLETQGSGKLPFYLANNLRQITNAVTLRSGKQLEEVPRKITETSEKDGATSSTECVTIPQVTPNTPKRTYVAVPPFS